MQERCWWAERGGSALPLMGSGVVIRSERLELQPLNSEDLEVLHDLLNEPEVRRYLLDDEATPRDGIQAFLDSSNESFRSKGYGLWLIHTNAGDFIGFCGLREAPWASGEVELLYGLYPEYWDQGYATEAASAVLQHAFTQAQLRRIVAAFDVPNIASGRVLDHLGMTLDREGELDGNPTRFLFVTKEDFEAL